jgi:hypothetical protein
LYEGFNIFEGPQPEPGSRGAGTGDEGGGELSEGGRDKHAEEPARTWSGEPGKAAQTDMFGGDSAQDLGEGEAAVGRGDTVRRHARVLALGALAICVLALAGALFGSGARRPADRPPAPQVAAQERQQRRPAPEPRQRKAPPPVRRARRPDAPQPASPPTEDVVRAPPGATAPHPPAVAELPALAPSPSPPPPRALPAAPAREFDFER